jgi:GNAT superfamily N-acetyltransferase
VSGAVVRLEERDVAAALRLSTQAGWNQLEADWLRLIRLWPDACFAIRDDDDQAIATSTLASFGGEIGWVGMVLVHEALRGLGLGGAVFGAALAAGAKLGFVGLDATDLGLPVYEKHGFARQVAINRWGGTVPRPCQCCARPGIDMDWPAILDMDRKATGVDRSVLLRAMSEEPGVRLRVIEEADRLEGFGFVRPGRVAGHVGPVVARTIDAATELVESLCDEQHVFIDVLAGEQQDRFATWLRGHGFTILRRLTRMAKPARPEPLLAGPRVFATAALELG